MLKTKNVSRQSVVRAGGRSRPRRSIRHCNDSSSLGISRVGFSAVGAVGVLVVVASLFEVGVLKLGLLFNGRGDICEALLELRGAIEGEIV
jgi:hypothetical protein